MTNESRSERNVFIRVLFALGEALASAITVIGTMGAAPIGRPHGPEIPPKREEYRP